MTGHGGCDGMIRSNDRYEPIGSDSKCDHTYAESHVRNPCRGIGIVKQRDARRSTTVGTAGRLALALHTRRTQTEVRPHSERNDSNCA